jgi:hypothetical protein
MTRIPKLKSSKWIWQQYQKAKRERDQHAETLRIFGKEAHAIVRKKYDYLQAQLSVWGSLWFIVFLLALPLLALAGSGDEARDGVFWQKSPEIAQEIWATGWMDGLSIGDLHWNERFIGLTSTELRQGITQFYEADYRNLKIDMRIAAMIVARYSRDGLTNAEAIKQIEAFREASNVH